MSGFIKKENNNNSFKDERQERIFRRLGLVGPGPTSFYSDACRLMNSNPPFKATTHLVAHLMREIESAIRDVLGIMIDKNNNDNKRTNSQHKYEIRLILKELGIQETDSIGESWLGIANSENNLATQAHRHNLLDPRPLNHSFEDLWEKFVTILDGVLEKFESRFLKIIVKIDQLILLQNPTINDVKKLNETIPKNVVTYQYFFSKLPSYNWIKPLKAHRMFQHPPNPIQHNGGYINPPWPESQYLARMAKLAAEIVLNTILEIPETDNIRIHVDFVDAACAMPAYLSAKWTEKEIEWIKQQQEVSFLLPQKYEQLISHLVKGGQENVALKLIATLLSLFPDPTRNSEKTGDSMYDISTGPKPKSRLDDWEYEEIIKKTIPDLIQVRGKDVFQLLIKLLSDAIKFSQYEREAQIQEDNSFLWRQSIEDREENFPHELRDILVSAVRDTAINLINTDEQDILELVESESFSIFKRIGLYLRQIFLELDFEGTAKRLINPEFFDNYHFQHEYFHLLQKQYPKLPHDVQQKYLSLVETGKDLQEWIESKESESGRKPAKNEIDREVRRWRYRKLIPIQDYLDQKWKQEFNKFKDEFGEQAHLDFPVYIGPTFIGPTSPKSSEELLSMDVFDVVEYLRSWQPSDRRMDASPEGLGRALTLAVATEPEKFSLVAEHFQKLDPTYVRALFSGFREANQKQQAFNWEPVLKLANWVVNQPREIPDRKSEYGELDSGWGWTRKNIASLLWQDFKTNETQIPFNYRKLAWNVLEPLTKDPEPTPEHEKQYSGSNMDPATLSINTIRGTALHAVVQYALWIRENQKPEGEDEESFEFSFTQIPEVKQVLEFHLVPENDPSFAIRAVYGQWFPWLALLDLDWTTQNVKKIFPDDISQTQHWQAAWDAYIRFCSAYDIVFDIIVSEYFKAINQSTEENMRQIPNQRLAEHLMVLYWRGKLNLEEKDGLLDYFYQKSVPKLHRHALIYVGRTLHESRIEIKPEIIERLKKLWEYRLLKLSNENSEESKSELEAFGWWFISKKFDDDWSLKQLKHVLFFAGNVDQVHHVLLQLKDVSSSKPIDSVECLNLLIKNTQIFWYLEDTKYRECTKTILRNGLECNDTQTKQLAEENIHRLGSLGFFDFRELIQ